ncbi:hypothetical protein D9M69_605730 [compost metagenome]
MVDHLLAVHVGKQLDRLAQAQLLQLAFLEVGLDPHLIECDHRQQGRTGLHALTQLHVAPRHVAVHRREQFHALERQVGLAHARRSALHAGVLVKGDAIGE